jgi:hypothetical protein
VKRPDFPLADAINWFLADYASEVEQTTLDTYRSHLRLFCSWLPEDHRTLQRLEPETAETLRKRVKGEELPPTRRTKPLWAPRYLVRRSAWHALDHACEIEDRAT